MDEPELSVEPPYTAMPYEQQRHIWEDNFKPIYAANDIFQADTILP